MLPGLSMCGAYLTLENTSQRQMLGLGACYGVSGVPLTFVRLLTSGALFFTPELIWK